MSIVLSSDRLILKPPQQADIAPWSELYTDPELTQFVGGAVSASVARQQILAAAGAWSLLGHGPFSAFERRTGNWIGCIGPAFLDDWPGHELGWRLTRGARGNGYATEGASLALDWTFATLGWSSVIHSIHRDNLASMSVARRLGATDLGATDLGELTYPPGHAARSRRFSSCRLGSDRFGMAGKTERRALATRRIESRNLERRRPPLQCHTSSLARIGPDDLAKSDHDSERSVERPAMVIDHEAGATARSHWAIKGDIEGLQNPYAAAQNQKHAQKRADDASENVECAGHCQVSRCCPGM